MDSSLKVWVVMLIISVVVIAGASGSSGQGSQELAKEQIVVFGMPAGDIGTIDPMGGVIIQDMNAIHHIFGSLVRYPIGDSGSQEFQPDLATKWEISRDKLTWTFHLRRGVKWHWGYGEVTSEDIVYSLNRVKNSKVSAWRGNYDNFTEIKTLDNYTVQIRTTKPEPFLLTKVANYFGGFILCKKALEKAGVFDQRLSPTKEQVVGTGPFKFVEYKSKDRITLVRNDDYWAGNPIIERVTYRYIPDDGAREIALLKGELTAVIGLADDKWIQHIKGKGMIVDPTGPVDLKALYFNSKIKPFDDKRIREAFAYGMSQESQIKFQGEEISDYCTSPVPSGTYGHIDAGWAKYKRDPDKAKKLLAEAGYPNGLTVKLIMSVAYWFLPKMILIQNELKECGINLEMTQVDHSVYKSKTGEGLQPFVIFGSRLPLATYWLRNVYHSESMIGSPKFVYNYSCYANPEVDRLIELAETTFDEKIRRDALAKVQKIIVEDLPAVPVVETRNPYIRNPWFYLGYEIKNNFHWSYEIGLQTKILKH